MRLGKVDVCISDSQCDQRQLRDEYISHLHVDHFLTCILVKKIQKGKITERYAIRREEGPRQEGGGEGRVKLEGYTSF